MSKKIILCSILSLSVLLSLAIINPALADEASEEAQGGLGLALQLITLIVVGGIIYNLWASLGGFGGMIGSALKFFGVGVLLLALDTLDEVIEGITGFGSETIFGQGAAHDYFHNLVILLGFIFLAWGLTKLTKIVKNIKS